MMRSLILSSLACAALCCCACSVPQTGVTVVDGLPPICPDYAGVTVPANIAAMNFAYTGEGRATLTINDGIKVRADRKGVFRLKERVWKGLLGRCDTLNMRISAVLDGQRIEYRAFEIYVAPEPIDPYISYRLIPPGYQGWRDMGIYQRCLENYRQTVIHSNSTSGKNCVNCHTYCNRDPSRMLFHARADFGGTMFLEPGQSLKLDTRTDSTVSALVYPYWHPGGRYVAFSVNRTLQTFFAHNEDRVEVFDSESDVVVLDTETMSISWSAATKDAGRCETFPTFSPDGEWLYFSSAPIPEKMPRDFDKVRYDIARTSFDPATGAIGDTPETVLDCSSKGLSASFPRISPDGRRLLFTAHKYGNFSIWHKDAELWMVDLESGEAGPVEEWNSPEVESWHCWSSNGRCVVFSSRRDDGLYTRPYIGYIDPQGVARKPFLLPQKNPQKYYRDLMYSYNLPEFTSGPVEISRRRINRTMRGEGVKIGVEGE